MNCSICRFGSQFMHFYGATCSRECARVMRITQALADIEHILRQLMLNQDVVR